MFSVNKTGTHGVIRSEREDTIMRTETGRTFDSIFIAVTGAVMAVLFAVAPFVRTTPLMGESVLEQARAYEQICQTTTPEERKALGGNRRC